MLAKLYSDLAALGVQFRTESFDHLSTNPQVSFPNYSILEEALGIHCSIMSLWMYFYSCLFLHSCSHFYLSFGSI